MYKIDLTNNTILITGVAGFVVANLVRKLLRTVYPARFVGLNNCNDYYDVLLKEYRLAEVERLSAKHPDSKWTFIKGNIADKALIERVFAGYKPDIVISLVAQLGVRYSITNPDAYIESNLIGFYQILESCRNYPVEHLVYASSSSMYSTNKKVPYSTEGTVIIKQKYNRKRASEK